MSQVREAKMYNEAKCTWPGCACEVPYYAFSGHNRVDFCLALKELDQKEAEEILRSSSG